MRPNTDNFPLPIDIEPILRSHPLYNDVINNLGVVPFTIAPEQTSVDVMWANIPIFVKDKSDEANAYALSVGYGASRFSVTIYSGLIDAIWCVCVAEYIFQVAYEAYVASRKKPTDRLIFDMQDPQIATGIAYLSSAIRLLLNGESVNWGKLPGLDSNTHAGAKQLTLAAFGTVLYHELGHIKLGHLVSATGNSLEELSISRSQEDEADAYAMNFIFSEVDIGSVDVDEIVCFRAWGAVSVMLAFSAQEYAANTRLERFCSGRSAIPLEARTHPLPYTRLDKVLSLPAVTSKDIVKSTMFSAATIPLYVVAAMNGHTKKYVNNIPDDFEELYGQMSKELILQFNKVSGPRCSLWRFFARFWAKSR